MTTLADKYPEAVKRLQQTSPNVAALAQCFEKMSSLDRVLGTKNAAHHWFRGRSRPGGGTELAAGLVLKEKLAQAPKPCSDVIKQPAPEKLTGTVLMVVCDDPAKVKRVLAMLGCEVEEIT